MAGTQSRGFTKIPDGTVMWLATGRTRDWIIGKLGQQGMGGWESRVQPVTRPPGEAVASHRGTGPTGEVRKGVAGTTGDAVHVARQPALHRSVELLSLVLLQKGLESHHRSAASMLPLLDSESGIRSWVD